MVVVSAAAAAAVAAAALLQATATLPAETPPPVLLPLPLPPPSPAEPLAWVLPAVLAAGTVLDPRLANCVWPYARQHELTASALCELDGASDELTFEVERPTAISRRVEHSHIPSYIFFSCVFVAAAARGKHRGARARVCVCVCVWCHRRSFQTTRPSQVPQLARSLSSRGPSRRRGRRGCGGNGRR